MDEKPLTTITHEDIGDDLRRIIITGRLDTHGTNAIADGLRELAATERRGVIVDLTAVEFAASVGIGQLIANAQAVKARGGHLVVLATSYGAVMFSLKSSGIDQLLPVFELATDAYVGALRGY